MGWVEIATQIQANPDITRALAAATAFTVVGIIKRVWKRRTGKALSERDMSSLWKKLTAVFAGVITGLVVVVLSCGDWSQFIPTAFWATLGASGWHGFMRKDKKQKEGISVEEMIARSNAGAILLLLSLTLLVLTPVAASADDVVQSIDTGFGTIEARAYKPLFPDTTLEFGGGLAVQLCVVPEDLLVLGSMLGGHRVFADVAYVRGQCAFGGSVSLRNAAKDDGLRLFGVLWKEDDFEASGGVAYGWKVDLKELF